MCPKQLCKVVHSIPIKRSKETVRVKPAVASIPVGIISIVALQSDETILSPVSSLAKRVLAK